MLLTLLKALADPCRLRLIAILSNGEFTVQELTRIFAMGQSRISHHLKVLTDAGLLAVKRQGTWSYYRVCECNQLFTGMRAVIEAEFASLPERSADLAAVTAILDERRRRSLEFFDQNARQWDDLARTLLPVPDYRSRLLALIPKGGTLLEIGVGTGGLLTELAALGTKVIGVDHSPAMLDEARRRVAEAGLAAVDLRLGEMSHLPLPDAAADTVIAAMVLHHAAEPVTVLSEIRRVLITGGTLLLVDLARHEREWAREQLADQWLGFEERELVDWLQAAGMSSVRCEKLTGSAGQESLLLVAATKK